MKVLMVLDHAPDYRESFLRLLGQSVDLTVVAQPCGPDRLSPPEKRSGYIYHERKPIKLGPVRIQLGLSSILRDAKYDAIIVGMNARHLSRLALFIRYPSLRSRWIWRGHIFGKRDGAVINALRKALLVQAAGCLTYSEDIAQSVRDRYGLRATSFNNSEVLENEFTRAEATRSETLNLLFVGRNQQRKKLSRLIECAERNVFVRVRLVGPGMDELDVPPALEEEGRVLRFGKITGSQLLPHFKWTHLVVNPGHVGLLVMNAARFAKPIAIDSVSDHAPEVQLAREAKQLFVDFGDVSEVDALMAWARRNHGELRAIGERLQENARARYTVEYMVKQHRAEVERVVKR